jgi:aminoglycoside 6'-N-acetyltransferase
VRVGFAALSEDDFEQLRAWLCEPHVSRWWGEPPTLEQVRDQYARLVAHADATRCYIVSLDARRVGMVQAYPWSDNPGEAAEIGALPGEAGIDYFIGEADLIGRGVGRLVLGRFLDEVVFSDPEVSGVRVPIDVDNIRSWRCLEKLGFSRGEPLPRHGGEVQYIPVLRRDQRSAAGQTSL